MNNTLLPCPFCGGEADIEEIPGSPFTNEPYVWAVGCEECNIGWYEETKEAAIAAWNRRAQPSEKPEPLTLGELRQMGGEPIWIKEFPPYAFAGYKVLSLRVVDVYGDIVCEDGDIYEYERYGKTWMAYRSKPKEEV